MATFETNECSPLTLFPLGVSCFVVQPSSPEASDGAASLIITGGTPPYTILWDNLNVSQTISNLSAGSYGATVTDTYGDFTAKTICVLTGTTPSVSPTPTPTPTPTPVPNYGFCMSFTFEGPKGVENYIIHFNKTTCPPSSLDCWVSDDLIYTIKWDSLALVWQLSGGTITGNLINPNPISPINNDWQIVGVYGVINFVTEGLCPVESVYMENLYSVPFTPLILTSTKNDTNCGCDGSIMINANGGYPPYLFSIDGGVTNQGMPIFSDLCEGSYTTLVTDSSGFTQNGLITLNRPKDPVTYTINLTTSLSTLVNNDTTLTQSYKTEVVVSPTLPNGVTIEFDMVHTNSFETSTTIESASLITNSQLTKNSIVESYTYSSVTTGETFNPIDGCQANSLYLTGSSEVWENLIISSTDSIIINTTTTVNKLTDDPCYIGRSSDTYSIINAKLYGCSCCGIQNITL
jgi:hypothetical protein